MGKERITPARGNAGAVDPDQDVTVRLSDISIAFPLRSAQAGEEPPKKSAAKAALHKARERARRHRG